MRSHFCKAFALCIIPALALCHCSESCAQVKSPVDESTFARLYPNARLLDGGKLNLYRYREYKGLENSFGEPESITGAALLTLFDGPRDHYCVQYNGQFEEVDIGLFSNKKIQKGFIEKIEKWFADDTLLVQYIRAKQLTYPYLPYLVRMYNGHAPRPFDPNFGSVPVEFVPDGLVDERDGRSYDIITISGVTWMAENLHYCNPTNSNYEDCLKAESWGYTWEAAARVCPTNWRLPDVTDWKTLLLDYGLPVFKLDTNGDVGKKMLKDSINSKGFNVVQNKNGGAYFWTFEEGAGRFNTAYTIEIWQPGNQVVRSSRKKSDYFSVRCVK